RPFWLIPKTRDRAATVYCSWRKSVRPFPASRISPRSRARGIRMSEASGRFVYGFGGGAADGDAGMKNLLGGKGANLAEMSNLGLPVPPGFSITTEVCTYFYAHGETYPDTL